MLIVYSMLTEHPASHACDQFTRNHAGWFTSALALLEAKSVMTKVYGVDPALATNSLSSFANGPIAVLDVKAADMPSILSLSDQWSLDLTDAVLLHLAKTHGILELATEDQHLSRICSSHGINASTPGCNSPKPSRCVGKRPSPAQRVNSNSHARPRLVKLEKPKSSSGFLVANRVRYSAALEQHFFPASTASPCPREMRKSLWLAWTLFAFGREQGMRG